MKYFLLMICWLCHTSLWATQPVDSTEIEKYLSYHSISATAAEDGLYYYSEPGSQGAYPQAGDYVMVAYTGKLLDGQVFDESEAGDPFVFQLGYRQVIRGWEKGLTSLPVGSKSLLFVPPGLGYGSRGVGKMVPPNASLIFEIEILEIMDVDRYDRYMEKLEAKEQQVFEQQKKKQFSEDKKLIHEYAAKNRLKAKRLPSGMSYVLKKKGKGDSIKDGDFVSIQYEGRLLDGTVFDKSRKPFTFQQGKKKVIEGWEEAMPYFRKGSEGWLLIPSRMAYGARAIEEEDISIPANSVLVFKIKVVSVKKH